MVVEITFRLLLTYHCCQFPPSEFDGWTTVMLCCMKSSVTYSEGFSHVLVVDASQQIFIVLVFRVHLVLERLDSNCVEKIRAEAGNLIPSRESRIQQQRQQL